MGAEETLTEALSWAYEGRHENFIFTTPSASDVLSSEILLKGISEKDFLAADDKLRVRQIRELFQKSPSVKEWVEAVSHEEHSKEKIAGIIYLARKMRG